MAYSLERYTISGNPNTISSNPNTISSNPNTMMRVLLVPTRSRLRSSVVQQQSGAQLSVTDQHTSVDDYCWQENTGQWIDELAYVFKRNKWTDCTVCIMNGQETVKIQCHKMILAKSSSVFESMLFGPLARPGGEITICDVSPTLFQYLLQFAYTGNLDAMSVAETCQLLHIADMYMMKHLKQSCSDRVVANLQPQDVCVAYEYCSSDRLVQEAALLIMETDTTAVLQHKNFLNAHAKTVLEIVKMKSLNIISEISIIWYVFKWAKYQAKIQNINISTENIRKILGEIFQYLRFLTINSSEFLNHIDKINLLTEQEKYSLLKFVTLKVSVFEEGFPVVKEARRSAAKINARDFLHVVQQRLQAKKELASKALKLSNFC